MSCRRCGNCCIDFGRTFWKNGNFERYPLLQARAGNGDREDNRMPCEMLRFEDGLATCLIEKRYGHQAKPQVCREHEGDERCGLYNPDLELIKESLKARICRVCGCTDDSACDGGCYWIEEDLCNQCL